MYKRQVEERLNHNAEQGRMRTDVSPRVLHVYLETVMDGFLTRLASGRSTESLDQVLDLVEDSVRIRE